MKYWQYANPTSPLVYVCLTCIFNELMHDWRHVCVCLYVYECALLERWVYVLCYVSCMSFFLPIQFLRCWNATIQCFLYVSYITGSRKVKMKMTDGIIYIQPVHRRSPRLDAQAKTLIGITQIYLKIEQFYKNTERLYKYRRKGSCRQRNTKHTPTSHAKNTHTHTTTYTASLIHLLVRNTRETYIKQM